MANPALKNNISHRPEAQAADDFARRIELLKNDNDAGMWPARVQPIPLQARSLAR